VKITREFDKKKESTHTDISSLKEDGGHISNNSEIANKRNNYFVDVVIQLSALIPTTSSHFKEYLGGDYCKSMLLLPTDEFEIIKILLINLELILVLDMTVSQLELLKLLLILLLKQYLL